MRLSRGDRVAGFAGCRRLRVAQGASALAVLVVAVLAAAATPAGAATKECFLLTQCTPVAGPWVVLPATGPTTVPAGATVTCPDSDRQLLAVGSDYELSGAGTPRPAVTRFMQGPGIGLITGGVALFYAINPSTTAGSFRPHAGCIPQPAAQAALQTPTRHVRHRPDARGAPAPVPHADQQPSLPGRRAAGARRRRCPVPSAPAADGTRAAGRDRDPSHAGWAGASPRAHGREGGRPRTGHAAAHRRLRALSAPDRRPRGCGSDMGGPGLEPGTSCL